MKSIRNKILKNYSFKITILTVGIVILTLLSSWRVLTFHFWRDDWAFLWTALHTPAGMLTNTLHPATWVENILLIPILGWNPLLWNILGLLLRMCASLSFYFMMNKLTSSTKIGILAGIIMASSYAGVETVGWSSVHVVPISIILMCLGLGFWFFSLPLATFGKYMLALLFLSLAYLSDPSRVLPVIIFIPFFSLIQIAFYKEKRKNALTGLLRYILLVLIFLVFYILLPDHIKNTTSVAPQLTMIKETPQLVLYFFTGIGNLLFGLIHQTPSHGATANFDILISKLSLSIMVILIITSFTLALFKKSRNAFLVCVFSLWIICMYIPNWLFNPTYIGSGEHRYLQISSVGMLAIIAIMLGGLKKTYLYVAIILIVILNIQVSNKILAKEAGHRSIQSVERLWLQVIHDRPQSQNNDVFYFTGDYNLIVSQVQWNGFAWPYIILSGMENLQNSPKVISNENDLRIYLCAHNNNPVNFFVWEVSKKKTSLMYTELNKPANYFSGKYPCSS